MNDSPTEAAERDVLLAEIEALQRRLETSRAEAVAAQARASGEVAASRLDAEAAEAEGARVAEGAERARAIEARIDELRREAQSWRAIAETARRDLSREAAAVHGLLARLSTVAEALGDGGLRRWSRREAMAEDGT